jgi:ferredoxin
MCMHCQDPACASACLVGALKKTALGPVTYDASKCIGCRYCLVACPFSVPRYEWTKLVPFVKKCDMCGARQAQGQAPACVEACPVGASIVGWRDEILEEAERRILGDSKYVKHIYGSEEAGGTSVFFISDVPFEKARVCGGAPATDAGFERGGFGRCAHGGAGGRGVALGDLLDHGATEPRGDGGGSGAGGNEL